MAGRSCCASPAWRALNAPDTRAPTFPPPPTATLSPPPATGVLEGKVDRSCRVDLPGGPLHIEWREADNHIYMTGPAELAFSGSVAV
jgi:hypothetical protein